MIRHNWALVLSIKNNTTKVMKLVDYQFAMSLLNQLHSKSALKKLPSRSGDGYSGVRAAPELPHFGPLLAFDLFSVESFYFYIVSHKSQKADTFDTSKDFLTKVARVKRYRRYFEIVQLLSKVTCRL